MRSHLNCEKIEKSRVEGAPETAPSLFVSGKSSSQRTGEAYLAGSRRLPDRKAADGPASGAMELLGAEVFEEDGTISGKGDHPKGAVLCFPKKVSGRRKMRFFCCRSGRCNKAGALCAGAGVVHLCRFLKAMGAEITGEGTEQITVYGRRERDCCPAAGIVFRVTRIAAGTYLLMGAATRGT